MAKSRLSDRMALRLLRLRVRDRRPAREAPLRAGRGRARAHADPHGHEGVRGGRGRPHHGLDPHRARRARGPRDAPDLQVDRRVRHLPGLRRAAQLRLRAEPRGAPGRRLLPQPLDDDDRGARRTSRRSSRGTVPSTARSRSTSTSRDVRRTRPTSSTASSPCSAGPRPGSGSHNACYHCKRKMAKTDVATIRRAYDGTFDPDVCFLSQGCICLGSVTLDRCLAPCMSVGVPCFSCGGPSEAIVLEPQKDVRTRDRPADEPPDEDPVRHDRPGDRAARPRPTSPTRWPRRSSGRNPRSS